LEYSWLQRQRSVSMYLIGSLRGMSLEGLFDVASKPQVMPNDLSPPSIISDGPCNRTFLVHCLSLCRTLLPLSSFDGVIPSAACVEGWGRWPNYFVTNLSDRIYFPVWSNALQFILRYLFVTLSILKTFYNSVTSWRLSVSIIYTQQNKLSYKDITINVIFDKHLQFTDVIKTGWELKWT